MRIQFENGWQAVKQCAIVTTLPSSGEACRSQSYLLCGRLDRAWQQTVFTTAPLGITELAHCQGDCIAKVVVAANPIGVARSIACLSVSEIAAR